MRIVPANEASFDDLQTVFCTRGAAAYCQCHKQPVGWCAVEPRPVYEGLLRNNPVPWEGRDEDKADDSARALEAYPILPETATWEEIHVGTPSMFSAAGLAEVSRPTKRRTVMRIDFEKGTAG
jgi:hypothetical protein